MPTAYGCIGASVCAGASQDRIPERHTQSSDAESRWPPVWKPRKGSICASTRRRSSTEAHRRWADPYARICCGKRLLNASQKFKLCCVQRYVGHRAITHFATREAVRKRFRGGFDDIQARPSYSRLCDSSPAVDPDGMLAATELLPSSRMPICSRARSRSSRNGDTPVERGLSRG